MKHALLLTTCLALFASANSAHALEEIIKNYRGSRSLGMGGVVFTTGLYDESLFANPATALDNPSTRITPFNLTVESNDNLLGSFDDVMKVRTASGATVLTTIADKELAGQNEHYRLTFLPGFYKPNFLNENTSLSFGLLVNHQMNLMLRSHAEVEMLGVVDAGPAVGVAHKFLNGDLGVGINMRLLYRLSADRTLVTTDFTSGETLRLSSIGKQGMGFDMDLGTLYKLPIPVPFFKRISVAASFNNIAYSNYQLTATDLLSSVRGGAPLRNDRTFNTGLRLDLPDLWIVHDTLWALEFQDIGKTQKKASAWKKFHMGAETQLLKILAVRAGFNQGYLTGGIGIDLPILKVNIATYGEELGSNAGQLEDRRVLLNFEIAI